MNSRVRSLAPWALVGFALVGVVACKSNVAQRLEDKKRAYEGSAESVLKSFQDDYDKEALDLFERRNSLDGDDHPLWKWRQAVAGLPFLSTAESLAEQYRETPQAKAFADIATALREARDFWIGAPNRGADYDPNAKGPRRNPKAHNQYMKFLNDYIAAHEQAGGPFLAQARLEREVIHAIYFAQRAKYDEDTQATSMLRFWKFAFEMPLAENEGFMPYVDRVCKTKFQDFCKKVMREDRPRAMNAPYLETLTKNLERYIADYPESPYKSLLSELAEGYQRELAGIGPFVEYPVLPDGLGTKAAVGPYTLVFGPRGVFWNDDKLLELQKETLQLDGAGRAKLTAEVDKRLKDLLREQEESGSKEPEVELVALEAAKGVPLSVIEPVLVEGFLKNFVFSTGLVARQRADGTNRKVATYLLVFYDPPSVDPNIAVRMTKKELLQQKQEWEAHDPRLKIPASVAGMSCKPIGRTGKPLAEMPVPGGYVAVTPRGLSAGPVSESKVAGKAALNFPAGKGPDWQQIEEWVQKLSKKPVVLAVDVALPVDALIEALQRLSLQCSDAACTAGADRDEPIVALALCR